MSSSTSSLSILTTVPLTIWPSSTSTIVPSMASAKDMPEVVVDDLAGGVVALLRRRCPWPGRRGGVVSDKRTGLLSDGTGCSVDADGEQRSGRPGRSGATGYRRRAEARTLGREPTVNTGRRPASRRTSRVAQPAAPARRCSALGVGPGGAPGDVDLEGHVELGGVAHDVDRRAGRPSSRSASGTSTSTSSCTCRTSRLATPPRSQRLRRCAPARP